MVDNKLFLAGGGGDHLLAGERWAALWSRCLLTASALNETLLHNIQNRLSA